MIVNLIHESRRVNDEGKQEMFKGERIISDIKEVLQDDLEVVLEKESSLGKTLQMETFKKNDKSIHQMWLMNDEFKTLTRLI